MIAPALAEIKPVYNPGEEKLVSIEVLKIYLGEDVIHQDPEDIDPGRSGKEKHRTINRSEEPRDTS